MGGGAYNATVVVGLRVRRREAEEEVGARKPETEPPLLGFGSAVSNSGRGRWWEVVGRFVEATAVIWRRVRTREVGEGVGGRKPGTELPWLGFGPAVSNSGVLW